MNPESIFIHYPLKITNVICFPENPRMKVRNKLFSGSVKSDSLDSIDKSLLTLILRNPIAIWVAFEAFLPPNGNFLVFAFFQASL
jgi:hypothetical protein